MPRNDHFLDRIRFREQYLATRLVKAEKILAILHEYQSDAPRASLLDIGCSRGHITERLAQEYALTIGVDCDLEVQAQHRSFHFIQADGCHLPLPAGGFEVVVVNHILEHVSLPDRLLDEVWRVVKPGGLAYLACPNRWCVIEPHYRLPFLSWLPRRWANHYVRWLGLGDGYHDNPPSYWKLKRMTRRFGVVDQTVTVLKQPARFMPGDRQHAWLVALAAKLPVWVLKRLVPLMPVWILILRKEGTSTAGLDSTLRKAAVL
jgi:SAM-dependent methyltransferase